MTTIRTVLCPVDFSDATARQLALATDLCRAFTARLVLHHNLNHLAPGAAVGWMWSADHPEASREAVEKRLHDLLVEPSRDLATEAHITRGPASESVVAISDVVDADLVVLSTHGATNDDHTSVTEQVLARANRAVLALHEAREDSHTPSFALGSGPAQVALVPTDLTPESLAAVALAIDLAHKLPLEIHLLHLLPGARGQGADGAAAADARQRMGALVPADLGLRAFYHVEPGDAVRGIVRIATELSAACIVMGEHTRVPLRRWFSRDTSRAVLHQAPCPVWYVPGRRAA